MNGVGLILGQRHYRQVDSVKAGSIFKQSPGAAQMVAKGTAVDVVIADTVMPGRTGIEICQYLKMSPRHRHVRVVLTAGALEPLDDDHVKVVEADGVIVATPTGSTAYSLAAGGPILAPSVDAFVITPVSPHALTNRPLVVPDRSEIVIEVKQTQEEAYLTVDGQTGVPLRKGDRIACRKSEHTIKLLHLAQRGFFDVLRTKLKWGER